MGSTASAPGISPHGDGLGVALDVLEVLEGAGDLPAVDGLGGLAGVLERNTEVGAAGAGGLGRLDVGGGVTDLVVKGVVSMVFFPGRYWYHVGGMVARASQNRSGANGGGRKCGDIPS